MTDNDDVTPIQSYVRDRMLADAAHVIRLADQQVSISHLGLRGRFREILVAGMLQPWLPPAVICGTGTVISHSGVHRSRTQEDLLLIDRAICPRVLADQNTEEGVYLRNSVLARTEIKSKLSASGVNGFIESCLEYSQVKLDLTDERLEHWRSTDRHQAELNFLFAFKSDQDGCELDRLQRLMNNQAAPDGMVSALCVVSKGFWYLTANGWKAYEPQTGEPAAERVAAFAGFISNTCFEQHIRYLGRDPLDSLEGGVGQYFVTD